MNRQRMEIMTEILVLCTNSSKKTRIMYQTNLSYAQLKNYLALLTSQGLLQSNSDEFEVTEKGLRFLDAFARLGDVLEEDTPRTPGTTETESYKEVQVIRVAKTRIMKDLIGNRLITKRLERSNSFLRQI